MCGIAGTFAFGDRDVLAAMTEQIAHRGPDGSYAYQDGAVLLGNRRLAIVDIAGGAQPMSNEDGSVVVVYNGEIYNYPELRRELLGKGHMLRTHCDTEILPHLYDDGGIEFARRLNGIFAFALWDRRRQILFLVRDPLGVKPLVYAARGTQLAFGSEAKSILATGLVTPALDEESVNLSMNVRYVPGEGTLFAGIRRLAPGHYLEVSRAGHRVSRYTRIDWTPDERPSEQDWLAGIRAQLRASVRRQLMGDVPVGVSLSGGIDSSCLVALAREANVGALKTFTLGFDEPTDELGDARFVAERFGTEHHETVLHEQAMAHLADAIHYTEEPKVNCLQLFLVHRFIGRHVKVALSGVGGDELFGGYDFYRYLRKLERIRTLMPRSLVRHIAAPLLDAAARGGAALGRPQLDLYVRGLEWIASMHDPARNYLLLRNAWDFNPALMARVYTPEFSERLTARSRERFDELFSGSEPLETEALRAEFVTKMTCDLLHNEDTMSMAHGVESRVPLLDLEMVRFAARIPDRIRFRYGLKGLLKKALAGVLPPRTLAKRKWGFTIDPVQQYRKHLRPMALYWLTSERLKGGGIFNPTFVHDVLAARPHPRLRWHYFMLWQMIGLEMWRETFLKPRSAWQQTSYQPAAAVQADIR
jgi:asparagine synthase (glutamine-hydrolysing)